MKNAPIITALDLWSLGHSASEIADMLGFPNFRHVARIVANARSIADPRAALHMASTGRLIGRAGHMGLPPSAERVPSIAALEIDARPKPKPRKRSRYKRKITKKQCVRGHPRNRQTVDGFGHCLACPRSPPRKEAA